MYFDSHVHSAASPDSEMNPAEAIETLKNMGFGITFTEHVDFSGDYEKCDPNATDAPTGIGDFLCDFGIYPAEYEKFRGKGVALGLEIGLTKTALQPNREIAVGDYDFIIGSIHSVDGDEIYHVAHGNVKPRTSFGKLILSDEANSADLCIRRYLNYAREMVEVSDFFDSFGHIDYIARYVPKLERNFFYDNFTEELDKLLKIIAERELALEINTQGFGRTPLPHPSGLGSEFSRESVMLEICRRFVALGGRFCTIGSDAHTLPTLGKNFKDAIKIAEYAGLAVVCFKERKPIRCG